MYRNDLEDKREDDTINSLKEANFRDDLYLLNRIGDYYLDNNRYEDIDMLISESYLILSNLLQSVKGDKLTSSIMGMQFYSLSELCYKSIDKGNSKFYMGLLTPNNELEKTTEYWRIIITNFICNVSLYLAEKGFCEFGTYHDMAVLGRTLAPNYIDVLKFIIDTLYKIGKIEKENFMKEGLTSLAYSRHRQNVNSIKDAILSIRNWGKQKDLEFHKYVDDKIIELDASLKDSVPMYSV